MMIKGGGELLVVLDSFGAKFSTTFLSINHVNTTTVVTHFLLCSPQFY